MKSYNKNMAQISDMVTGLASLDLLRSEFSAVDDENWRAQTQDVCNRLYSIFGKSHATWYASNRKPVELYDQTLFKPAIRGVWVKGGRATATAINARQSLFFNPIDRAFIARGIQEFYLIDDPGLHDFIIIDLGAVPKTTERATRVYGPEHIEPMSLEPFEVVLRKFMMAVERAGFSARPNDGQSIADLFRRKR